MIGVFISFIVDSRIFFAWSGCLVILVVKESKMAKSGVYEPMSEVELLVGAPVRNSQGEELGRVYKVLMDESTGQISNVVLSHHAFFGLWRKRFSIPWDVFHFDETNNALILEVEKEFLERVPSYKEKV